MPTMMALVLLAECELPSVVSDFCQRREILTQRITLTAKEIARLPDGREIMNCQFLRMCNGPDEYVRTDGWSGGYTAINRFGWPTALSPNHAAWISGRSWAQREGAYFATTSPDDRGVFYVSGGLFHPKWLGFSMGNSDFSTVEESFAALQDFSFSFCEYAGDDGAVCVDWLDPYGRRVATACFDAERDGEIVRYTIYADGVPYVHFASRLARWDDQWFPADVAIVDQNGNVCRQIRISQLAFEAPPITPELLHIEVGTQVFSTSEPPTFYDGDSLVDAAEWFDLGAPKSEALMAILAEGMQGHPSPDDACRLTERTFMQALTACVNWQRWRDECAAWLSEEQETELAMAVGLGRERVLSALAELRAHLTTPFDGAAAQAADAAVRDVISAEELSIRNGLCGMEPAPVVPTDEEIDKALNNP